MTDTPEISPLTAIWWRLRRRLHGVLRRVIWQLKYYGEPDSELTIQIWRRFGAKIGENVNLNPTCHIDRGYAGLLEIQDNVVVAMGTAFILHDSSVNNLANGPFKIGRIVLEEDVYIGAFAIILPGVVIGKGALVAAGSLVNSDVAPGMAVAGRPARLIGNVQDVVRRFKERSSSPSEKVTYMSFLSQNDRKGMTAEELKAFVLHSNRQVTDWIRTTSRHNDK
jgi:maltose O-acetyltransferase